MKMIQKYSVIFFLSFGVALSAQNILNSHKNYDFIVYDGSEMFTMNQFNQNYLSGYRIFSRTLDETVANKKTTSLIKMAFIVLLGTPLTHEEGHRSILTSQRIGSVSQPFFNSKGAAYVKGVTDATLKDLRENSFANYIRLHTGGLESDYALTSKIENLLFFNEESYQILKEEYLFRKLGVVFYHFTTFLPSLSPKLEEENDELKRDIVGHDIWGMVRHLHRPKMRFYRYTNFDDLTNEEKKYAKNLAWKSFLNLLNPMLFGKIHFNLSNNLRGNASVNHSLAPFGDFLEQNFWLSYNNSFNTSFYIREYMNKTHWFWAGGMTIHNIPIHKSINTSVGFDIWSQPQNFSFTTPKGKFGANGKLKITYHFFNDKSKKIKNIGLFSEIYYKSVGFIPEYASLENDFGLRIGFSFSY